MLYRFLVSEMSLKKLLGLKITNISHITIEKNPYRNFWFLYKFFIVQIFIIYGYLHKIKPAIM